MKYTNLRRAAIGATLIVILGVALMLRTPDRVWVQRDYMLISGATVLILLNLGASYYMDRRNHQKGLSAK
ncbi:hypothetical protein NA78x_002136 [Anatilimnocola sp. NA78]|uniref:hypothetical protein n=1 Tax=Anatilimnocola sp. NA78 TaxID=3415683 RepID=UPI003CE59845